ncbi:flagellar export protein FliJ [Limnochorda pilosa]|uniref:Flagellar FliJ protein n=1 Tax=Limnochorda pilosa TaxID=1555112 RepID=A0A0K2SK57_LIMPI|nr:flagellar export protein FliJ [Limnochorda pilosa]BAS27501.1 flagellar export protein FliJ [Limnochorda pilosa]
MARFEFRLDGVYRWKQREEEAARDAWVQAHRRLNQARAELLLLEEELGRLGEGLPSGAMDGADLQAWAVYASHTRDRAARQQEEVVRVEGDAGAAFRGLVAASQERRLFERLREKERVRFVRAEEHREQREQDEMAGVRVGALPGRRWRGPARRDDAVAGPA